MTGYLNTIIRKGVKIYKIGSQTMINDNSPPTIVSVTICLLFIVMVMCSGRGLEKIC